MVNGRRLRIHSLLYILLFFSILAKNNHQKMKYVLLFGLTFILAAAKAQDFEKRIASHRQEYKEEFLKHLIRH